MLHRNCSRQATPHNLEVQINKAAQQSKLLNEVPICTLMFFTHTVIVMNMIQLYIDLTILGKVHYLEIQGLFKDFCHNSRTFQGFMQIIQRLFKTRSQIQGLSILYEARLLNTWPLQSIPKYKINIQNANTLRIYGSR